MLNLSDFKLTETIFEVRYDNAYMLWDRAGEIWAKTSSMWPNLEAEKVEPSITTFRLENKYQLSVNLGKAHIIDLKPSLSLNEFMEKAENFIKLVIQTLKITNFIRVGFRLVYIKSFSDKFEAANSLLSTKMLLVPSGRLFGIEGKVVLPRYAIVCEGDSAATRVLLEVRDKKVDFDPPPNIEELSPVHLEKYELLYDVDYYTLSKVSIGQLNMKEWLSQIYHLVKRDSKYFLGGS